MKYSIFFLFAFLGVILLPSCKNDSDLAKVDTADLRENEVMDRKGCFELVYPVTVIMPDGSRINGDDRKSLGLEIRTWYKAHPDAKDKPSLEYPVTVIFDDDSFTVNNDEELKRFKDACDDDWKKDCFEFIFPISMTMPDGTIITGQNKEELEAELKAWYEAHPDNVQKFELVFPLNIKFGDEVFSVENEEELHRFKEDCDEDWEKDCFEFIFPISMTMPDGTTITGQNKEELEAEVKAWYEAHPDYDQKPALVFPFEIKFGDEIFNVENEEELQRFKEECEEYDCPELKADIGDACRFDDGTVGTINENCECE